MFLKSLSINGFKSFPEKTYLEFSPGVSVIIGPNGSGKSNITDAVLWALGEQSPGAIRGTSMQDVISVGGKNVGARSSAEVEVVIDNSDGGINSDFTEIAITRKLDRAGDGEYRLRGAVAGLSGSSSAYAFTLRGVAIRTNAGTDFDGTPANGVSVSVRMNPTQQGDGSYLAERLKVRTASYDDSSSAAEGEVEGYVSDFTTAASAFRIAGYPVRLGAGVAYEDGVATDLKDGIRVEAKGRIDNGVLVATKLEFKSRDDDDDGDDDDVSGGSQEFEFKGSAACISCADTSGTFTVKGVTVRYDAGTEFKDGIGGSTLDGKTVEVKCVGEVTSIGTTYRATKIELHD